MLKGIYLGYKIKEVLTMINNAIEKFRVDCENSKSYVIYYKMLNKAGKAIYYCYTATYNRLGILVYSPERRISELSYNSAKTLGKKIL
jgi:hypothetical protein